MTDTNSCQIEETIILGRDVDSEDELNAIIAATPPVYRFQKTELLEEGIKHITRIIPQLWREQE